MKHIAECRDTNPCNVTKNLDAHSSKDSNAAPPIGTGINPSMPTLPEAIPERFHITMNPRIPTVDEWPIPHTKDDERKCRVGPGLADLGNLVAHHPKLPGA